MPNQKRRKARAYAQKKMKASREHGRPTNDREALARIVTWDDPRLAMRCRPVEYTEDDKLPGEALAAIEQMKETLQATGNGIGLAAPQIGSDLRIFLTWCDRFARGGGSRLPEVLINPALVGVPSDTTMVTDKEGCLSYPGISAPVSRYSDIYVSYRNDSGHEYIDHRLGGMAARVFQHELDHLNGVCLVGDHWRRIRA